MFARRCDLVAQAVLATHADGVVGGAVKRHCNGMCAGLLLPNEVDVDVLANLLDRQRKRSLGVTELEDIQVSHIELAKPRHLEN